MQPPSPDRPDCCRDSGLFHPVRLHTLLSGYSPGEVWTSGNLLYCSWTDHCLVFEERYFQDEKRRAFWNTNAFLTITLTHISKKLPLKDLLWSCLSSISLLNCHLLSYWQAPHEAHSLCNAGQSWQQSYDLWAGSVGYTVSPNSSDAWSSRNQRAVTWTARPVEDPLLQPLCKVGVM